MKPQLYFARAGGARLGDEYTAGLCSYHHRGITVFPLGQAYRSLGPSLAREPREFREVFGSDEQLLAEQNGLIERREAEATTQREREAAAARAQASREARRQEMTERDRPSVSDLCEAVSDWFEVDIDITAQCLAETSHADWMALAASTEAA